MALRRSFIVTIKLLYVGISLSTVKRLIEHKDSPWFGRIAYVKIERFATRKAALIAEQIAIATEGPECNKAMNNGSLQRKYKEPPYQPAKDERHILHTRLDKSKDNVIAFAPKPKKQTHPKTAKLPKGEYLEKTCANPDCPEGGTFLTRVHNQKFCSPYCNNRYRAERLKLAA